MIGELVEERPHQPVELIPLALGARPAKIHLPLWALYMLTTLCRLSPL